MRLSTKKAVDVDKVVDLLREINDKDSVILLLSKVYVKDRWALGEVLVKYLKGE